MKVQRIKDTKVQSEELQKMENNWKRALADYQNLVKRVELEKREFVKFTNSNLVTKLLPTLDILELAAHHSGDQGIQMAVKQFQTVLKEEGLEELIPTVGDPFDPTLHECIETVPGSGANTIAELLTKGYKLGGLVIKPANVKVGT